MYLFRFDELFPEICRFRAFDGRSSCDVRIGDRDRFVEKSPASSISKGKLDCAEKESSSISESESNAGTAFIGTPRLGGTNPSS